LRYLDLRLGREKIHHAARLPARGSLGLPCPGQWTWPQTSWPVAATTGGTLIRPAVDVPSPGFWDSEAAVGRGGQAARIELDDNELYDGMSTWYRLSYVDGGSRLQVFEHSPIATVSPESDMMRIETVA